MEVPQRIIMLLCIFLLEITRSIQISINVKDFGAVGNGQSDDTKAFIKAWDAVCQTKGLRPTMVVPAYSSFLVQPIDFKGPCSSSPIIVQIMGQIVAPNKDEFNDKLESWITFQGVTGLIINGNGGFDGSATFHDWWDKVGHNRPPTLRISTCKYVSVSDLTFLRPPRSHISISDSMDVTVQNVTIMAPEDSPNTDGIDIARSLNVNVRHSVIQTGDDCIAVNGGSSRINVTNINCGPGHGISIGSLGRHADEGESVEYVHVKNCIFNGTMNAARIKTSSTGSGFARFIAYENITLINTQNPILIDQNYCPHKQCDDKSSKIKLSNVSFVGFKGTSDSKEAVNLDCSPIKPCEDIKIADINIQPSSDLNEPTTSNCINAHGNISCTTCVPKVTCLQTLDWVKFRHRNDDHNHLRALNYGRYKF